VLDFPRGSTIVDFAYRIHSQVGNHLIGARVNGRMVPLRYKLESGDTVEVLTSEKQVPGKDWLNWAATARAKSRIRQWLRAQESQRSIQVATAMLDHELGPLGLTTNQLRRDGRLEQAVKELSAKDIDTLLAQVGYGIVSVSQLLTKVLQPEELQVYRGEKAPAPPSERPSKEARKAAGGGVVVSGLGDVLVRFAQCCNPLPGERITGFITRGRGVTIHLVGCPRALETDPQRRVPVVWKDGEESPHPIRLEVICVDKPGVLAAITKNIAAAGINISTAQVKSAEVNRRSSSLFELNVTSARQLNTLMHSIAAIDGVLKVTRIGQHNGNRPA